MRKAIRAAGRVLGLAALLLSTPALAVDGIAVELGKEGGKEILRAAAQWQWQKRWLVSGGRHVGGYWDVSLGHWRDDVQGGQNDSVSDFGLTPTLRWQADNLQGFYVEGGIGAHYISRTSLGSKRFSTRFQFGDHIGFGYRFGPGAAYDLGYRFQHMSNADIKKPNDGINFHQLRLQYWFR
ncbi:MAG: acyloxyacyl hydrolase [Burkholderiales bacterium]|nr:acyloxyacyl hydrolase [Burkholderiales bacterium]